MPSDFSPCRGLERPLEVPPNVGGRGAARDARRGASARGQLAGAAERPHRAHDEAAHDGGRLPRLPTSSIRRASKLAQRLRVALRGRGARAMRRRGRCAAHARGTTVHKSRSEPQPQRRVLGCACTRRAMNSPSFWYKAPWLCEKKRDGPASRHILGQQTLAVQPCGAWMVQPSRATKRS